MKSGIDIKRQINVHEMLKDMFEVEKEYILKKMLIGPAGFKSQNYEGLPHGSGAQSISMDRSLESIQKIQNQIDLEIWAIDSLTQRLITINTRVKELTGLDAQVIWLRDYDGMTLGGIADKLGYSEARIKQISCRNQRHSMI